MHKLSTPYHLPHNSVRVDEFDFMLNTIDTSRQFYTYDELRLLFLEKEIEANVFDTYHSVVHNRLKHNPNEKLKRLYHRAINGDYEAISKMLEHSVMYTDRKSFRQVWNEFVRDYTEFFAFLGLLPTYYKGLSGGENKHYITSLLQRYQNHQVSLQDLLLSFKFRNSSKDYKNLDMYHIEVRPFILAIKALSYYRSRGITTVNPHIISAIVSFSHNEFDSLQNCLEVFDKPNIELEKYADSFETFTNETQKEIGRVTLLLKPYLKELGVVEILKRGNTHYYSITSKVSEIRYPNHVAYCNGSIGKYKLTPLIGKIIYTCLNNPNATIPISALFDTNFSETDKKAIIKELLSLGILKSVVNNHIMVAELENQYDLNPFTDFMTYNDACYVANNAKLQLSDNQIVVRQNLLQSELAELKQSALSSDGTAYERSLYTFFKNNLQVFSNLNWYGAAATGKRLSDIACTAQVFSNGATKNILIIMECKAAAAIRAFDERKERDDIINLLKTYRDNGIKYDGVWYWVTDSNSLPDGDIHGGYRSNQMSKSLLEKLNILQFDISEESRLPSIVTAFSIDALTGYLSYIHENTHSLSSSDKITETLLPHFWRWSKKFMNVQYVTIHKQMTL